MHSFKYCVGIILLVGCNGGPDPRELPSTPAVVVGSKKFTESVILGEVTFLLANNASIPIHHKRELGGTRILWSALVRGDIDLYPEYTGTIAQEILGRKTETTVTEMERELAKYRIKMTRSLGFNNTYALGIKKTLAQKLGIQTISDLKKHSNLRFGLSHEFIDRADGWKKLRTHYHLPHNQVFGLDHDLAYQGLQSGQIDITDLYSTDAEIAYYHLAVLEDDLQYFPQYQAVYLYREDLATRVPELVSLVTSLEGKISETDMIRMNAASKLSKDPEPQIAASFIHQTFGVDIQTSERSLLARVWQHTLDHLVLLLISLLAAVVVGVPLGIMASFWKKLGQGIIAAAGILQTIPSLAILVFMIPVFGIGPVPAIVALFLYGLLPIVRNTTTALTHIPIAIAESAQALGLPPSKRLLWISLPMASRTILAGIKTSAVITVGTATLGALIGAGGYGQPILTGIRLDNVALILEGAIPAAAMALLVEWGFSGIERCIVPRGLRWYTQA